MELRTLTSTLALTLFMAGPTIAMQEEDSKKSPSLVPALSPSIVKVDDSLQSGRAIPSSSALDEATLQDPSTLSPSSPASSNWSIFKPWTWQLFGGTSPVQPSSQLDLDLPGLGDYFYAAVKLKETDPLAFERLLKHISSPTTETGQEEFAQLIKFCSLHQGVGQAEYQKGISILASEESMALIPFLKKSKEIIEQRVAESKAAQSSPSPQPEDFSSEDLTRSVMFLVEKLSDRPEGQLLKAKLKGTPAPDESLNHRFTMSRIYFGFTGEPSDIQSFVLRVNLNSISQDIINVRLGDLESEKTVRLYLPEEFPGRTWWGKYVEGQGYRVANAEKVGPNQHSVFHYYINPIYVDERATYEAVITHRSPTDQTMVKVQPYPLPREVAASLPEIIGSLPTSPDKFTETIVPIDVKYILAARNMK